MIDDRLQELAGLHALGALPPDEAAAFDAEMAGNPALRDFFDECREAAASLVLDLPGQPLPPGLRDDILSSIREDRAPAPAPDPHFSPAWIPWALAAGFALLAGVVYLQLSGRSSTLQERVAALTAEVQARDASLATVQSELASAEVAITELRRRNDLAEMKVATLTSQLDASYLASIAWDETAQEGILHVRRLPETEQGKEYQLWVFDPKYSAPVSGGVFTVKPDGSAVIHFAPAQKVSEVTAFAVTLEKEGGVPKAEGPVVLSN